MTFAIGTPHARGAGYYCNDKELRTRQEDHVQQCAHCEKVLLMTQWKEDGGWCGREMKPICGLCADRALTFGCEPFLKKLETYATKQMQFVRFAKFAGLDVPVAPQPIVIGTL